MTRILHIGWVIGLIGMPGAWSQPSPGIYVSTGEHGELRFSDVAEPGAERVEVAVPEPREDAEEELERRIEQTLMVAKALEESRLAREQARAEARAAAARNASGPLVIRQDRYVSHPYLVSPFPHTFDRHGRFRDRERFDKWPHGKGAREEREPKERTRSREFLYGGN